MEHNKISSATAKVEAVIEQTKIRVEEFGWSKLYYSWSKGGDYLISIKVGKYAIKIILPHEFDPNKEIRSMPRVKLPSINIKFKL